MANSKAAAAAAVKAAEKGRAAAIKVAEEGSSNRGGMLGWLPQLAGLMWLVSQWAEGLW